MTWHKGIGTLSSISHTLLSLWPLPLFLPAINLAQYFKEEEHGAAPRPADIAGYHCLLLRKRTGALSADSEPGCAGFRNMLVYRREERGIKANALGDHCRLYRLP